MASDETNEHRDSKFGTCCQDLKEVLSGADFEPLLYEAEDGVLYLSVGILDTDEEENAEDDEEGPGFLDHPVYFCPFCGTRVQTPEDVEAKAKNA
jgi:hypothetical protein